MILKRFWNDSEMILKRFWDNSETILRWFWNDSQPAPETVMVRTENILYWVGLHNRHLDSRPIQTAKVEKHVIFEKPTIDEKNGVLYPLVI